MSKTLLLQPLMVMPISVSAVEDEFFGTYALVSSSMKILETGEVKTFTGERGFINYSKDGRMIVLIVRGERPKAESVDKMTDQQRVELFRSTVAYGGTFEFDGGTIKHHIDISWNEVWTGITQLRDVKKEDGKLIYTTRPAPNPLDGRMSITTLAWEKVR